MTVVLRSLSEQVYDHVIRQIKLGKLLRGDSVSETKLAEQFNTSRTTAREALFMLVNNGILVHGKKRGFIIKGNTEEELLKKWALIAQLDAFAAELALSHITETHLSEMESLIKRMHLAIELLDHEFYTDTQEAFHNVYYQICDNEFLVEMIFNLQNSLVRLTPVSDNKELLFEQCTLYNAQHSEIVRHFRNKEPEALRNCIIKHYTYNDGEFLF